MKKRAQKPGIDSAYLQSLHRAEDIGHRLSTGQLLATGYDMEMTDLDRLFAFPTHFAAILRIFDRIIGSIDVKPRVPEWVVEAPAAAVIVQASPQEIHYGEDRDPPHIAAGKIAFWFRTLYRRLWDALDDEKEQIALQDGKTEEVRLYKIRDKDGRAHIFRLHDKGKWLSMRIADGVPDDGHVYRDAGRENEKGARWKKIAPPAMTGGFNNIRADDMWLMTLAFMTGNADIIVSYLKKNRLFRVDVRAITRAAATLNIRGENGIQAAYTINPATGQRYASSRLSDLMLANTHRANSGRGLEEGIRMPDGSFYEERLGHQNPLYDVLATESLLAYDRWHDPEVVAQFEKNADLEKLKNFLMGNNGFNPHPLRLFLRSVYPDLQQANIGICAVLGEEIKERQQGLFIRTDTNAALAAYTYRGKHLHDMDADEWHAMLTEQRGQPDALCEIIDVRKSPAVFESSLGFARGLGGDPDWNETVNRKYLLELLANPDIRARIKNALERTTPVFSGADDVPAPRAEDHIFEHFRELKRLDSGAPHGKIVNNDDVDSHAMEMLRRARDIRRTLLQAMEPDPVEWFDELPGGWRKETVEKFAEKITKIKSYLRHRQTDYDPDPVQLPDPDNSYRLPHKRDAEGAPVEPDDEAIRKCADAAVEYLWKMRAALMHAADDYSLSFRITDRHGHEVPFDVLDKMDEHIRRNKLANGEFRPRFENRNYTAEIIARMFATTPGRMEKTKEDLQKTLIVADAAGDDKGSRMLRDELREWDMWGAHFDAVAALHLNGPPHVDSDDHRWMSARKGQKIIARINRNLRLGLDVRADAGQLGLWEILMTDRDKGEQILDALAKHYDAMLEKYPLTAERLDMMGYGVDGWPVEHVKYIIPAGAPAMLVDVADAFLDQPLHHIDEGSYLVPVAVADAPGLRAAMAVLDTHVLLRGRESGRVCYAARAKIIDAIKPSPHYNVLYEEARSRTVDSGAVFPSNDDLLWLKMEQRPIDAPLSLRAPETTAQTIKMRQRDLFDATVSEVLGRRARLVTGLVFKDEGFAPHTGMVRLQEMRLKKKEPAAANDNRASDDSAGAPRWVETGWERAAEITTARSYTCVEFQNIVKRSLKLRRLAARLGLDDSDALRNYVVNASAAHEAGFKNLAQARHELDAPHFTHEDALACGYHSLEDMAKKAALLFVENDRNPNAETGIVHMVFFKQVARDATTYFRPAERHKVERLMAGFDRPLTEQGRKKLWANAGKVLRL